MSTEEPVNKEAAQSIVNFLEYNVPKSDVPNIANELKKDFILAKTKGKKLKKKSKKKKTVGLSKKEKKALGFTKLPRDSIQYKDVLPMYELWIEYMNEILELNKPIPDCTSKSWEHFTQTIYKADFHGAMLTVIRSKCPTYVGKTGICIMDTKNTFKIVSEQNLTSTIPKPDSEFQMTIKDKKLTFFGKQLCARPAERSSKKIKNILHPDL